MFNKILCPSDLSETSLIAIRKAAQLARLCDAELILLNVRPEFMDKSEMVMLRVSTYEFLKDEGDMAVAAKQIMEEELKRVGGGELRHQTIVREGDPHSEILETAESLGCDLIVLTTTGRNKLLEHFKGSSAEKVVGRTHVPILVFPVEEK